MKSGDSKLLLGLLLGAAVGATITYLTTTDKKDQILDELRSFSDKVKDGYQKAVSKYHECKGDIKEEVQKAVEE